MSGAVALGSEPVISQVFVVPDNDDMEAADIETKMFMLRKVSNNITRIIKKEI